MRTQTKPLPGYVYAMEHPAWRSIGVLKIGHTVNDPSKRLRQITSSSGLLAPGHVAFCLWVSDCVEIENSIKYDILRRERVRRNRELYRVTANEARMAIIHAAAIGGGPARIVPLPQQPKFRVRSNRRNYARIMAWLFVILFVLLLLLL